MENEKNKGYWLGALMWQIEENGINKLRGEAVANLIVKFYEQPKAMLSTLFTLSNRQKKFKTDEVQEKINDILKKIGDDIPRKMTIDEQGGFWFGYYLERK